MDDPGSAISSSAAERADEQQPSLIMAIASVLGVLATSMLPALMSIFLPDLMETFGVPLEELSGLFLGRSLLAVALVLPIAFLADRYGYAYVLAAVLGASSFCMLSAAFSTSLDYVVTVHVFATMLSFSAIPIAMVLVYHSVSVYWRSTSIAVLLLCPIVAGPLAVPLIDADITRKTILIGFAIASVAFAAAIAIERSRCPQHVRRLRPHVFDGRLVWLIAAAALLASVINSIPAWVPSLMIRFDGAFREAILSGSNVLTYPTLGLLSGILVGGLGADVLGRITGRPDVRIGIASAALATIATIAATRFDQAQYFFGSLAIATFGFGATLTLAHSFLQRLANRQFAAAAAAVIWTAAMFGMNVGSGVASSMFAVFDRTRGVREALDHTFVWLSIAGIAATTLFYLARRVEEPEQASIEARQPIPRGLHSSFVRATGELSASEDVKNGFSWPAFFFGPIWALTKGMVPIAGALLLMNILLVVFFYTIPILHSITGDAVGTAQLMVLPYSAQILWAIWVGARGNSWRRRHLVRRGYEECFSEH